MFSMRGLQSRHPQRKAALWAVSIAIACLIVLFVVLPASKATSGTDDSILNDESLGSWQFNTTRDEKNYGLSDRQCDIGSRQRPISHADTVGDVHWGECRAMLYNNEVCEIPFQGRVS
jgi:hypothetical protein